MVARRKRQAGVKRGLIYTRVSGEHDQKEASRDVQLDSTRAKAKELNCEVAPDDVTFEKHSGQYLHSRPKLAELRRKLKSGDYDYVFVHAYDRLSRKMTHAAIIDGEIEAAGAKLVSSIEDGDESAEGKLLKTIRFYLAEAEIARIGGRTRDGVMKKIQAGRPPCSGHAKFGYRYDREGWAILVDEPAAKVVRDIFEWVAAGSTLSWVSRTLNARGVATYQQVKGSRREDGRTSAWHPTQVSNIIRSEAYKGAPFYWNKVSCSRTVLGERVREPNVRENWTEVPGVRYPRVIADELWVRANLAVLDAQGRARGPGKYEHSELLPGMVYCEVCGTKRRFLFNKNRQGRVYGYYRCRRHSAKQLDPRVEKCASRMTRADFLDDFVWEKVSLKLREPRTLDDIIEHVMSSRRPSPRQDVDALKKLAGNHKATVEALRPKWSAALSAGETEFAEVLEMQLRRSSLELQRVEAEISAIEAEMSRERKHADLDRDGLVALVAQCLKNPTLELKRELLRALGCKVLTNGSAAVIYVNPCVIPSNPSRGVGGNCTRRDLIRAGYVAIC